MTRALRITSAEPWEQVLVRHVAESKRTDMDALDAVLETPFEAGTVSLSSGSPADHGPVGRSNWMMAVRFSSLAWVPLFSAESTGEELFQANTSGRHLEVVHLGFDDKKGEWFFKVGSKRKTLVDLRCPDTNTIPENSAAKGFSTKGIDPQLISDSKSAKDLFKRLCDQYEISFPINQLAVIEDHFAIIGARSKPIKHRGQGYIHISGPAVLSEEELRARNSPESIALEVAINNCDPEGIRQAVAKGASLTLLPESSSSPLQLALYKCSEPQGKECVELLIDLGCPPGGVPGGTPTVISCCHQFNNEELSAKMLEIILPYGIDVDARDQNGRTALFESAVYYRKAVVELLLQHGADPTLEDPRGDSPISWMERLIEKSPLRSRLEQYQEMLCILRGEAYDKPEPAPLEPQYQAENDRFQAWHAARQALLLIPENIEVEPTNASRIEHTTEFPEWDQQLSAAGFQHAGNFIRPDLQVFLRAYTNEELNYDAVIQHCVLLYGDKLQCEINACHRDGSTTTATNFPTPDMGAFPPRNASKIACEGASPEQLISELTKQIGNQPVEPIEAKSFLKRYVDVIHCTLADMREQAEVVLATPAIFIGDEPARFERVGFYRDIAQGDPQRDTTATLAASALRNLEEVDLGSSPDAFTLELAVSDSVRLLAMRHLQFAGATEETDFIVRGCEIAKKLFETLAKKRTKDRRPTLVEDLAGSLLLAAIIDHWDSFNELCNLASTRLAQPSYRDSDSPPQEFDYVILSLVSDFRQRKLTRLADAEQSIRSGRPKRPKRLLKVWQTVRDNSAEQFHTELCLALKQFSQESRDNCWDVASPLAIPESLMYLAAARKGIEVLPIDRPLSDYLVTAESIGL